MSWIDDIKMLDEDKTNLTDRNAQLDHFFDILGKNGVSLIEWAMQWRRGSSPVIVSKHCGSFNFCIRLHLRDDDDPDWLIRFPIPGKSMIPDEKVRQEVAVMRFVREKTSIPVPEIILWRSSSETDFGLGPFIIMNWIEGIRMSEVLAGSRAEEEGEKGTVDAHNVKIDPDLAHETVKKLYGQMASIYHQLWQFDFDKMGALEYDESSHSWSPTADPITSQRNELIRIGGMSPEDVEQGSSRSSSLEYFVSYANLHFKQLEKQPNSCLGPRDGRQKYTCRHLFRALVPHFTDSEDNHGPFKLVGDDLRPGNVLVDEKTLEITGVLDWEFFYVGPAQLAATSPMWLLLKQPYYWVEDTSLAEFEAAYAPKLDLYIETLRQRELTLAESTGTQPNHDLSNRIRRSFRSRQMWFNFAIDNGFSLDSMYWNALDNFCFGKAAEKERVAHFIGAEAHQGLEDFVKRKCQEINEYMKQRGEDDWGSDFDYAEPQEDERAEYWRPKPQTSASAASSTSATAQPIFHRYGTFLKRHLPAVSTLSVAVAATLVLFSVRRPRSFSI